MSTTWDVVKVSAKVVTVAGRRVTLRAGFGLSDITTGQTFGRFDTAAEAEANTPAVPAIPAAAPIARGCYYCGVVGCDDCGDAPVALDSIHYRLAY